MMKIEIQVEKILIRIKRRPNWVGFAWLSFETLILILGPVTVIGLILSFTTSKPVLLTGPLLFLLLALGLGLAIYSNIFKLTGCVLQSELVEIDNKKISVISKIFGLTFQRVYKAEEIGSLYAPSLIARYLKKAPGLLGLLGRFVSFLSPIGEITEAQGKIIVGKRARTLGSFTYGITDAETDEILTVVQEKFPQYVSAKPSPDAKASG